MNMLSRLMNKENRFKVISTQNRTLFLDVACSTYERYCVLTGADEIPSLESILELVLDARIGPSIGSMLLDIFDEEICWKFHRESPETYPAPDSQEWREGDYFVKVQEVLYDCYNPDNDEFTHDVSVAFNILNLSYFKSVDKLINSPVCEVW